MPVDALVGCRPRAAGRVRLWPSPTASSCSSRVPEWRAATRRRHHAGPEHALIAHGLGARHRLGRPATPAAGLTACHRPRGGGPVARYPHGPHPVPEVGGAVQDRDATSVAGPPARPTGAAQGAPRSRGARIATVVVGSTGGLVHHCGARHTSCAVGTTARGETARDIPPAARSRSETSTTSTPSDIGPADASRPSRSPGWGRRAPSTAIDSPTHRRPARPHAGVAPHGTVTSTRHRGSALHLSCRGWRAHTLPTPAHGHPPPGHTPHALPRLE